MIRLIPRGMKRPARSEPVVEEVMPTSHGMAAPPRPAAPKNKAPIQLESRRKISTSQVTKMGYCAARPNPAIAAPVYRLRGVLETTMMELPNVARDRPQTETTI